MPERVAGLSKRRERKKLEEGEGRGRESRRGRERGLEGEEGEEEE
jgi:hypothetical protein